MKEKLKSTISNNKIYKCTEMMPNARCPLPLSNSKSHNAYLVRSDVTLKSKKHSCDCKVTCQQAPFRAPPSVLTAPWI